MYLQHLVNVIICGSCLFFTKGIIIFVVRTVPGVVTLRALPKPVPLRPLRTPLCFVSRIIPTRSAVA